MRELLRTERLWLRAFTAEDLDRLYDLDSDPMVMRFINGGTPASYEEIKDIFLPLILDYHAKYDYFGFWAVCHRQTTDFMGWLLIRPAVDFKWAYDYNLARDGEIEIGWRFLRSQWGKGYATEGATALVEKGFQSWGIETYVAWALADNRASIRVMEKLGMSLEREFNFEERHLPDFSLEARRGVKYRLEKADFIGNTS